MVVEQDENLEQVTVGDLQLLIDPISYAPPILKALRTGVYEGSERNVIPNLLRSGDRVIEIGSAIGVVSMVCAQVVGADNVLSFEANPQLVGDARRNFALNGLQVSLQNVVLQNRALWSGPQSAVEFHIHKDYWASSLKKIEGTVLSVEVATSCLEDEIEQWKANVIVCDIEGGEIDLLTEADLSSIDRILLEIHYWAGRDLINALVRKLVTSGFSVDFQLSGRSVVTFRRDTVTR